MLALGFLPYSLVFLNLLILCVSFVLVVVHVFAQFSPFAAAASAIILPGAVHMTSP